MLEPVFHTIQMPLYCPEGHRMFIESEKQAFCPQCDKSYGR